ncbi:MAG: hypothetical protein IH831_11770 [Planctomycetes bacterium]|nr:hypothetical protein [Planctomycetota bacterium]
MPINTDRQPSLSTDDATTDNDSLTNKEPVDQEFAIDDEAVNNLFADFNGSLLEDLQAV